MLGLRLGLWLRFGVQKLSIGLAQISSTKVELYYFLAWISRKNAYLNCAAYLGNHCPQNPEA